MEDSKNRPNPQKGPKKDIVEIEVVESSRIKFK